MATNPATVKRDLRFDTSEVYEYEELATFWGPYLRYAPAVTGPLLRTSVFAGTGFGISRTGIEYTAVLAGHEFNRVEGWGFDVDFIRGGEDADDSDDASPNHVRAEAADLARQHPFVESPAATIPRATGNLITDVRALSGLTTQQIADLNGVRERTVFGWRDNPKRVPPEAERLLNALRAISATLVGGLGPAGVSRWLLAGPDPPASALKAGDIDEVVERAGQYVDSVAT